MTVESRRAAALDALRRGDAAGGLAAARAAVALAPDHAGATATLSTALLHNGRWRDGLAAIDRARRLGCGDPALADNHRRAAAAWSDHLTREGAAARTQGRFIDAEVLLRLATELTPERARLHNLLGVVLTTLGRLDEAAACFRRAVALRPDYAEAESNLLFCLNYDPAVPDEALKRAHAAWGERHGAVTRLPRRSRDAGRRRLRLGYVSANFNAHPVGWFLAAVLPHHDRAAFAVVCYDCASPADATNARLRAAADAWHEIPESESDEALARRIHADGIDILVDLAGHTARNRLRAFAHKPAPLQVSWLGWFHTTGLAVIDAVLMDPHTVPPGEEVWFTEPVVRLPHSRFCYAPPPAAPAVAPPPSQRHGAVTFGSFNNLSKVTPAVIALWARVLRAVPDGRLLLKWRTLAESAERHRLAAAFAGHGIDPARLELRGASPHAQALAEYADLDIALDPFPFSGGLTSCEALWMGVPLLTWPGRRPVSRQSHAFLSNLGLAERLSAASAEDYVAKAAALAADGAALAALRAGLRPRMAASPLCDGPGFTAALEAALHRLWHETIR